MSAIALILTSLVLNFSFSFSVKYYGTKTLYEESFTNEEWKEVLKSKLDHPKTCHPIYLSAIFRHGTRSPSTSATKKTEGFISRIKSYYNKIGRDNAQGHAEKLLNWSNRFSNVKDSMSLAEKGREEMRDLASRFAKRIEPYINPTALRMAFTSSNKSRSIQSAESFRESFLSYYSIKDEIPVQLSDIRLRFFSDCPKLRNTIEKNKNALKEYYSFPETFAAQEVIKKINMALNIPADLGIQKNELKSVFSFCGCENAVFGHSKICDLIEEHRTVFEYLSDLKAYWRNMYGYKLTSKVSCTLLKDIFEDMLLVQRDHERGIENFEQLHFQFGHAETLMPIIAALGLFRDSTPLRADEFKKNIDRKLRVSKIAPFSTNLAFVLYHCKDENKEDYKLQLLFKERPIPFPACESEILCDLEKVLKYYHWIMNECHRNSMCEILRDEL
ncbi:DgyrCDS4885 [Dimorphilus gyrociliatus]|uniref:Multiple inositol polyphosphate phosphatase 1 n=1 Tax=Dimorphilus gyrociliatus TaxID=2664684 RepID=A0A7I8VIA3_9ANNE|nr:DgyrCDS4885 [Dimorphilus gyrociliatus]